MDYISQLERRISNIERQLRYANKELVGVVTANEDPEGRNRIKVSCPDVYGEAGESPWLTDQTSVGGPSRGTVDTPKLGDNISFRLRDGNPDVGEYYGAPRNEDSTIPEEFQDVNINGFKTESGITVIKNDNDGSYTVHTKDEASKIVLTQEGEIHCYGTKCYVHSETDLNSDAAQYGVVTGSPSHVCPFSGLPHACSLTVRAAD